VGAVVAAEVAESVARVPGGEAAHLLPGHPGVAEGAVVLVLLVVDHLGDDLPAHHARVAARARSAVEVDGLATGDVVADPSRTRIPIGREECEGVIDADGALVTAEACNTLVVSRVGSKSRIEKQ